MVAGKLMLGNEQDILPEHVMRNIRKTSHNFSQNTLKFIFTASLSLALIACTKTPKNEEAEDTVEETSPDQIPSSNGNRNIAANDQGATPMLERVAVMALLNKRTGESRTFKLNPDKSIRFGNVVVKVQACERTAPWETYPDIGAFTQLFVKERPPGTNDSARWRKVFSGWLHKNNPAQNVVEHPIYDVWVKDCIMLFPGETAPPKEDISLPDAQEIIESSPDQFAEPPRSSPSPEQTPSAPETEAPTLEVEPVIEEEVTEEPLTEEPATEDSIIVPEEEFTELDDLIDSEIVGDDE